jgi:hypothetical protein
MLPVAERNVMLFCDEVHCQSSSALCEKLVGEFFASAWTAPNRVYGREPNCAILSGDKLGQA